MKSCITSTRFKTTNVTCTRSNQARRTTVRILKTPSIYCKDINALKVDLFLSENNLVICGTYLYLKYITDSIKPTCHESTYL